MAINLKKEQWIAIDGSIYTLKKFKTKAENSGVTLKDQHAPVAFNVGREIAEHIVAVHNASKQVRKAIDLLESHLGDSDGYLPDDYTQEELEDEFPVEAAFQVLTSLYIASN